MRVALLSLTPALLLGLLAPSTWAADLWLEPSQTRPEARGRVGVRARLGDATRSRPVSRRPERLEHLRARGPAGWVEVPGQPHDDPAGMVPLQGAGLHAVVWRGKLGFGRLGAAGLQRLIAESGARVEAPSEPVVHLVYRREAKALLHAGEGGQGPDATRPLGLELELTPLLSPHQLAEGAKGLSALPLRLTWSGRPVVGAELRVFGAGEHPPLRTDARGEARLRLPRRGRWVIAATALRAGRDLARYEVAFTSLSFDAAVEPPTPGAPALAAVLTRALESGAIQRVLGRHCFRFDRRSYDEAGREVATTPMLMTYELSLDRAAESLVVAVDVSPRAEAHAITFRYEVGLDGRFRRLTNRDGEFALKGSALALPQGATAQVEPRLLLPKVVGVFALPMLHDQGLPARIRLVDLTPFATLSRPLVLQRVTVGPELDAKHHTWTTEEGRAGWTTRVRVAREGPFAGKLVEIRTRSELDAGGRLRALNDCRRLSPAEFARSWKEWFGEAE